MDRKSSVLSLFDLTGRSALVIGATGAFGSAAARALAGAGAKVTLSGQNEESLKTVREDIAALGASVDVVVGRPDSEQNAARIVSGAKAHGQGLDILVVASGTSVVRPAIEMTMDEWDTVMEANVRQSWLGARAAGQLMLEQGRGGKIILISSVRAQFAAAAGTSAYSPSKAAVDMLTKSFAAEWGKHKINVNAIAPSVFRSELTGWLFEEENRTKREGVLARIPLGRLAEPDDFAGAILLLASSAGDYITGEILRVDGGFSAD